MLLLCQEFAHYALIMLLEFVSLRMLCKNTEAVLLEYIDFLLICDRLCERGLIADPKAHIWKSVT